jgi:membrane protease YdiL (CAAX protease family)
MEASEIKIRVLLISIATIVLIEATKSIVTWQVRYIPMLISLGAARLLEMGLIVLIVSAWGRGFSSIGLAPSNMLQGLKKGLVWSAIFGLATFFAFLILFLLNINPLKLLHTRLPTKTSEIVLFFFIGGLIGPVAEEVFFRGVLYGFFRRWGVLVALILSGVAFVLAHPVLPGLPVTQVVGAVIFAMAYEVAGSLMAPITIHVLGNSCIFTLSLLPLS